MASWKAVIQLNKLENCPSSSKDPTELQECNIERKTDIERLPFEQSPCELECPRSEKLLYAPQI